MQRLIEIPYGRGIMPLHVREEELKAVLTPRDDSPKDRSKQAQLAVLRAALDKPIDSPPLHELAKDSNRVLVITSDHTRPVPSRLTMPLLLSAIRQGNRNAQIKILLATGMHRPSTKEEILEKFGPETAENEVILNHVSTNTEDMVYKGVLPSGGELRLNSLTDWADLVVAEGFIEPHFFAGFSGGRKSILPGIAANQTVLYNHNAGFIADERAIQGSLQGNPLHMDMCFAAKAAGLRFIFNVRLDSEKRVIAAYAGDPFKAHEAGCKDCLVSSRVQRVQGEIVVTSNGGYPLDQNIYQAVKGMSTGAQCVQEGGVIIMAAEADGGHGGEMFYQWFASAKSPGQVAGRIAAISPHKTLPDQWEAQVLARVLTKARCIFVTHPKNRELVTRMHMTFAYDLNAALSLAREWMGQNASLVVIPDGVGVIPQ